VITVGSASSGYCVVDEKGKVIVKAGTYRCISNFSNGLAVASGIGDWDEENEKLYQDFYIIDSTGKELVKTVVEIYDDGEEEVTGIDGFDENGYAVVTKNGKYGVINTKGTAIVKATYDTVSYVNGYFYAAKSGTYKIINTKGKTVYTFPKR
jgi:hypothetical protein